MTSIPSRNGMLGQTLLSLSKQATKPDEIRLYLTPGCKPFNQNVLNQAMSVPTIVYWTDDFGPLTKLSTALDTSLSDDTIIVTVDDDIVYSAEWLTKLTQRFNRSSIIQEAHGFSGWDVDPLLKHGRFETPAVGQLADVLEGWSGIAYRRDWFKADLFNAPPEFRFVDDVWISSYLNRRGILRRVIDFSGDYCKRTQEGVGISSRPDFVQLNQDAARYGFGFWNDKR